MKMRMKHYFQNKRCRDLLCVLLLILIYTLIVLFKTENGRYLMASNLDFSSQHYTIPEYLRTLFYDTGDLLPDFSFHLGAGQNIYCLSYYGLFSPIVLLSYLFPSVAMLDFIIVIMALTVLSSVILFYFFLKKNGYSQTISFLCAFMFLCATPLIFHSARHIMFVNYMPFLILGLYGADRYVEKKKSFLLILSITLMIFTSYYFSIPGMIALFVYGLFKYVRKNQSDFKTTFKFAIKATLPYITSVLIAGILILPTLAVLFSGRSGNSSSVSLLSLFLPNMYMLYSAYSMGLTLVCAVGCLCLLFSRRIENRILSGFLLLISIFPIFNYCLNAFLYINAKALIPFIPLVLINTADFLTGAFSKLTQMPTVKHKALIQKGICLGLAVSSLTVCIIATQFDHLANEGRAEARFSQFHQNLMDEQLSSETGYRVNTSILGEVHVNRVVSPDEYKTSLYSSTFNGNYRNVYRHLFENPLYIRNEFIIASSNNLIFQMYMGEKYIYSPTDPGFMYEEIDRYNKYALYENPYVLPIGYATTHTMKSEDFAKLPYPTNILTLLGTAVTDTATTNKEVVKPATLIDVGYQVIDISGIYYQETKDGYTVTCEESGNIQLQLQDASLKNKLIFLDFSLAPSETDLSVSINGICNLLTASDWKYYNQNSRFAYVIANEENMLDITFSKGDFQISDISLSVLDFDEIKDINKQIDAFVIDRDKTKGDIISGTVDAQNDGVFLLSIPYDEGFTVYVDGKETKYYLANQAFIGFDIAKGEHEIVITYKAPLKNAGIAMSGIGLALLVSITIYEKRKKEKTWN